MARPTRVAWTASGALVVVGAVAIGGLAAGAARHTGHDAPAGKALVRSHETSGSAERGGQNSRDTSTPIKGSGSRPDSVSSASTADVSISADDIKAFVAAHSAALKSKNRAAFIAGFDTKHPDLALHEGQLFDNLRKIPLTTASYSVSTVSGSGATATAVVTFVHQITGVDSVPVVERYKWTVQRTAANGPLEVVAVSGAPAEHNYPAPWDAVAGLTVLTKPKVVIMADDSSAAFAKSHASALESDAEYDLSHWTGGPGTAPGFAVFLTADRARYEGIYSQDRAESVGVTVPIAAAGNTGNIENTSGFYPSSRIAVDTTQYKNLATVDADIVFKHEMAHAMIGPFDDQSAASGQNHLWVVEGFAEWESQRMYSTADLLYNGVSLHAYLAKHSIPTALPTDSQVYSANADVSGLGYFYSHMAMRYIAAKYSPAKVDQFVLYVYKHATGSTCVDDAMKNVLATTTVQFTQGFEKWLRSSV
ncbi:hypothetical protein KGQ20_14170 [Catenulispora sp. NF23]|uniref:Peptidase M1 membrane alanine aminopeptidase domain-containing protein n=1 Tax=Catenulispora pinistramenti TaxID=2705254 RepID=A0ABS5KXF3_9ACTN|nr:hypothetical protein [Catenulispora pinistramenti]MBS2533916.1 hypothetical protein [Catenulispora pinistramenti]MBS2550635.1 hypothetical protein [Catenulispora pinistramenti]